MLAEKLPGHRQILANELRPAFLGIRKKVGRQQELEAHDGRHEHPERKHDPSRLLAEVQGGSARRLASSDAFDYLDRHDAEQQAECFASNVERPSQRKTGQYRQLR